MKKQLVIGVLLIFSMIMTAQSAKQQYSNEWKKAEKYNEDDLPQSAISVVDGILKKAIADKNSQQIIKALIYKNNLSEKIDPDDAGLLVKSLEKIIPQTNNIAEKALLHSIVGELYNNYYTNNYNWYNSSDTYQLEGPIPEDMKEWTPNIYRKKIIDNLNLSIENIEALKKHQTKEFDILIISGTDSPEYYPTLFDFLMKRAIEIGSSIPMGQQNISSTGYSAEELNVPAGEFIKLDLKAEKNNSNVVLFYYQTYFKDLLKRGLTGTMILTELDKINTIDRISNRYYNNTDKRLKAYEILNEKYSNNETSVEITDKIIDLLESKNEQIYDLCNKTITKYPNYKRIDIIKNRLKNIESPSISIKMDDVYYPQALVKAEIIHRNIQAQDITPTFLLYKIEKGDSIFVKDYQVKLVSRKSYESDTLKLDLGKFDYGSYTLVYKNKAGDSKPSNIIKLNNTTIDNDNHEYDPYQENHQDFKVSALASFSRNSAKDKYEIFVVDRLSGKPIKGANITIKQNIKDEVTTTSSVITNDLGLAIFEDKIDWENKYSYERGQYTISLLGDSCLPPSALTNGRYNYSYNENSKTDQKTKISIFTDRSIYRPGQALFYKAIAIGQDNKVNRDKLTVTLYNPTNNEIAKEEILPNEFGSITGQFILPKSGMSGQYRININGTNYIFRVEEYKRPTFEITFDKVTGSYTFGEEIHLKGYVKNFSGISLQEADVQYQIKRQEFNPWFRIGYKGGMHFDDGTVKTKEDGSFEIVFIPKADDSNTGYLKNKNFTFNITATVTDVNGETQTGDYSISVGNSSMIINVDVAEQIEKSDSSRIEIKTVNLQGEEIKTRGSYILYRLQDNDSIDSQILTGTFETGIQKDLRDKLRQLISGKYRLAIKALDSKDNDVEDKKDFILYSFNDKKPPIKKNGWLVKKNVIFEKDKPAEIIFGVSDKDIYVLYQIYNNDKIFNQEFIKLSETNKLFKIPYKEEYGDGVNLSFTFVKDNTFFSLYESLQKKSETEDVKLALKFEVFRDKLLPGQEETWTISVKDNNEKASSAELLASMYDISLDKIYQSNRWFLNRQSKSISYIYPISYQYNRVNAYSYPKQMYLGISDKASYISYFEFDYINWFWEIAGSSHNIGNVVGSDISYAVDATVLSESKVIIGQTAPAPPKQAAKEFRNSSLGLIGNESKNETVESENIPNTETPIRTNFNETAFFYPQLKTNDKGETLISFKVPDSNTTWKFRALAHDKNSKWGNLEKLVVTRKELMVTPNLPRFVRQGDKTSISTKISNMSENDIAGNVHIEFFNPYSDSIINLNIKDQQQIFTIAKGASASVVWTFDIPQDIDLIGCRIIAQNETFSDGEQHVLSVLPNRILVTESMPINVNKSGESTFIFDNLKNNASKSLDTYRITFEYANNPAWYAIQALPTLNNPTNENVINWFASYYVNTLGTAIVKQYPKVAAMIDIWKKQGDSKETLISKLQKDEELKNILLEETPWVLDAQTETEQMQRLGLLFDLNNTKQLTATAVDKLKALQSHNGGWTWYNGMTPSRSITQYILYGFGELQLKGVEYPEQIKMMQMEALKFVDGQILDNYNNLKKNNKDWKKTNYLSTGQLEYLFVRSYYRDIPINVETREAERFYTSVASKNWTKLSLYERSILSIVANRNGDKELASKIAKSIKEYAKVDNNSGMYWPRNKSNVFISMSAISTHTFLMKSQIENGAKTEDIDLMKQWLLKQKQTQVWESTHATIEAINMLLSTGNDWFTTNSKPEIKVGDKVLDTKNEEFGTGYIKHVWNKTDITPDMNKVSIIRTETQPAYGAMYWQYYEDLDQIGKQEGDLNVSKQLYKEFTTNGEKTLQQIDDNNPLTVGDKVVVRIIIKASDNMEFVHLKDMRAACFEPIQTLSGTKWKDNMVYYQTTKDASTNFYFDYLTKGTHILEYSVYVTRTGEYTNGISTIQCLYAPEYISHTTSQRVHIK
ncbi:MAG: alpha-2-macroglobulin family protein [Dysgonomonas sp.]